MKRNGKSPHRKNVLTSPIGKCGKSMSAIVWEKIAEAAKELENLNFEYDTVTSYLKDMEEIEAIPEEEAEELKSCAKRVELLQNSRDDYMGRKRRMSDSRFQQIERMLDEIEEGCSKLREAEQYQELIKRI